MPTLNTEAARRQAMRALALSRRKGDTLTCDGGSAVMMVDGKAMRPALSEAEKKARDHAWWLRSIGPW
jgi:hypothetical protein